MLSAAIRAEMARGMEPADACVAAKRFVEHAITAGVELGAGVGPVDAGSSAAWRNSSSMRSSAGTTDLTRMHGYVEFRG